MTGKVAAHIVGRYDQMQARSVEIVESFMRHYRWVVGNGGDPVVAQAVLIDELLRAPERFIRGMAVSLLIKECRNELARTEEGKQ